MSTSRKKKNEFTVFLSLNLIKHLPFIHTLPQKPNEWGKWIDEQIWDNFIKCCSDAVPSQDMLGKPFLFGMIVFYYLLIFAAHRFGFIASRGWILFWIALITIVVMGMALKYNEINDKINKIFINDVKSNLTDLNNKYNKIIKFTVNENIVTKNGISTISIKIELLAKININCNAMYDIQRRLSISQQQSRRQRQFIEQLLIEQNQIKSENDKSKHLMDSAKLAMKCNELAMKCNELEIRYNEKVKKSHYTTWDAKDITNWIVNLDKNRYNKYYHDLLQNMINENINGYCLNDLDKNDLHRLGIIQFQDKKDVYDSLQQLIQNKVAIQHEGAANETEYH